MPRSIRALWCFIGEMVLATIFFIAIATGAFTLECVVHFLEGRNFGAHLIRALNVVELVVFAIDVVLYLIFVIRNSVDLAKAIWNHN